MTFNVHWKAPKKLSSYSIGLVIWGSEIAQLLQYRTRYLRVRNSSVVKSIGLVIWGSEIAQLLKYRTRYLRVRNEGSTSSFKRSTSILILVKALSQMSVTARSSEEAVSHSRRKETRSRTAIVWPFFVHCKRAMFQAKI